MNDQVVERVRDMVTRSPVSSVVPIVLGRNVLKDLDLLCLLAEFEHSGRCTWGCGLQAVWLNVIWAHQRAVEKQPEQMGVVCIPPK